MTRTVPGGRPGSTEAAWHRLASALTGELRLPGDPAYRARTTSYNTDRDTARPQAVVSVAGVADVRHALDWAGEHGLPVAVRASGHSYAGYSLNDGLVVDVGRLDRVHADGDTGLVTVGGGTTMTTLYRHLQAYGMAFPAGNSSSVAIGGLTLGGGVAAVSRAFGLTCDALVATEVVTADGRLLRCDARENSDLFWACRGGGGGNFGVNVSFTFQARPVGAASVFALLWRTADAARLFEVLQQVVRDAPDEFSTRLGLAVRGAPGGAGDLVVSAVGQYLGPAAGLREILDPALTVATPAHQEILDLDYWAAKDYLLHDTPGHRFAARNRITDRPLSPEAVQTLLAALRRWPGSGQPEGAGVGLFAWGGAMNRVPATATAFVHRDALFAVSLDTSWAADDPPELVAANRRWLGELYEAMGEYLPDRSYQNFTDPDLRDWRTAYYGENYPRLTRVKSAYDPGNLFRFDQSVTA